MGKKGGDFERDISKKLSLWFTGGEHDDVFWHTQGSGGRATNRRKRDQDTKGQHGDICATDEIGSPLTNAWSIELKTGYAGKNKVRDADGKTIKLPVTSKRGKNKGEIIKHVDKVELVRWDVLDLVDSKKGKPELILFWEQAKRDAELSGRIPVLIFRRNLRDACIAFSRGYFSRLVDFYGFPGTMVIQVGKKLCILNLNEFFGWIPDVQAILLEDKNV